MPQAFTPEERQSLRQELLSGRSVMCPRCRATMDRREVPPRPDVSYVRDRVWVVCPRCHASAVLDRRETSP